MADEYGLLTLPATSEAPVGDPGLAKIGAYLQAVINANLDNAWHATQPEPTPDLLVSNVLLFNPMRRAFNVEALPALFVWRMRGKSERIADQILTLPSTIQALWIPPALPSEEGRNRDSFWVTVAKAVSAALEQCRHPDWFDTGDPDPTAISYAASSNSIMTSKPTSTTPFTYSGALLDGTIGGAEMSPRRGLTLTTMLVEDGGAGSGGGGSGGGGGTGPYNTNDPIPLVFKDWSGATRVRTVRLSNEWGGETLSLGEDARQFLSMPAPAQWGEEGSFTLGTQAVVGRGSQLLNRAGLERIDLTDWDFVAVEARDSTRASQSSPLDGEQGATNRLPFFGLQLTLAAREFFQRDLSLFPAVNLASKAGAGIDLNVETEDGTVIDRASLPDSSTA